MSVKVSLILGVSQSVEILTEDKGFPVIFPDIFYLKADTETEAAENCIIGMQINPLSNQTNKAEDAKPLAILDFVQISS